VRAKAISLWGGGYVKSSASGSCNWDGQGGGEDEASGTIDEVIAQVGGACSVGAGSAEGFSEGSDEDVRADAELGTQASAGWAEGAKSVGFIDDEGCVVGRRDGGKVDEWGYVAVHAEEGFCDQESPAPCWPEASQMAFGRGHIKMTIEGQLGSGKTTCIDDAGVNGAIGHDQIVRAGKSRENAEVGLVPCGKEKCRRKTDKDGEVVFESDVLRKVP
jgi:hypothetical protein